MPLDLLRSEQERIGREIAEAKGRLAACQSQFEVIEDTLTKALTLLVNCQDAYRRAKPQTRRQLNKFFFDRLLLDDGSVVEERPAHLTGELRAFVPLETKHPGPLFRGQGLNIEDSGGGDGIRTHGLSIANAALCQLSYTPVEEVRIVDGSRRPFLQRRLQPGLDQRRGEVGPAAFQHRSQCVGVAPEPAGQRVGVVDGDQ